MIITLYISIFQTITLLKVRIVFHCLVKDGVVESRGKRDEQELGPEKARVQCRGTTCHPRTYSGVGTRDDQTILGQLKTIAVKKQNVTVNRMKLSSMKHDHGEPVRKFAGRVRTAEPCHGV